MYKSKIFNNFEALADFLNETKLELRATHIRPNQKVDALVFEEKQKLVAPVKKVTKKKTKKVSKKKESKK